MAKENDGGSGAAVIDLDDIPVDDDKDLSGDRGDDFDPDAEKDKEPKKEAPKKDAPKKKEAPNKDADEPEGDSEEDEEEDPEEEEGEEGDGKDKKTQKTIPIQRMDAIKARLNKKVEAAEARARELEAELRAQRKDEGDSVAAKEFFKKIDSLYEAVEQARLDGNAKEAAKLQRELDTMKEQASTAKQQYMAKQEALQIQEVAAYNAAVDFIEAKVPELDPNSDDFDEDLMEDIQAVTRGYEERGMRPVDALKKALKVVLQRDVFAPEDMRKKAVLPKKTDVKKNIDAAKRQPPDSQEGAPPEKSQKLDVSKLTDEEFEKLPEQTKRRLRGDYLT